MKRPRFSLRTLFVLIALISLPMAWVAYQRNWIRQRHVFLAGEDHLAFGYKFNGEDVAVIPMSLRIFGESPIYSINVKKDDFAEIKQLFPEAKVFDDWEPGKFPPAHINNFHPTH
ncbi:MAG TPA: hypothetical protein VFE46_02830 [Pirellulales bacterium]|jgi:hypothetical protein|nr:hypothetical protein [Pirellulales bacterium]